MNNYDGPTLRAIRESIGIPLRRIARTAGMSHGHLSKVERGEHGRPVTPAIIAAYERVTGVTLAEAAAKVAETRERQTGRRGVEWTPGKLTDMRRKGYNAAVGALTVGGPLGEPVTRLIDSTGRPVVPIPPDESDLVQLEQVTELITALDLRHGGGLVSQLSRAVLRWAAPMLDLTGTSDEVRRRLYSAIGCLAHRTGWAAFDVSAHEAARSLFRLALYAAALEDEADRNDASQRLTMAIDQFDTSLHARAHALCVVRLAMLRGKGGDPADPAGWTTLVQESLPLGGGVRSGRLRLGLAALDQPVSPGCDERSAEAVSSQS